MVSKVKLLGRIAVKSYTTFSMENDYYSPILLNKLEVNQVGIKVDTKGLEEDILKYMKTFSKEYAKEGSKQITNKFMVQW